MLGRLNDFILLFILVYMHLGQWHYQGNVKIWDFLTSFSWLIIYKLPTNLLKVIQKMNLEFLLLPMLSLLNSDNRQVSGKVLVYKHPGLHFGDIHKLTATHIDGLEEIVGNSKYAIFFPTSGSRSLADEMANSDFDGDMYWVSWNPQVSLVSHQ